MDNKDYIDELFENLKRDNLPLFCLLSKGNPGACMVLISLFKEIEDIDILKAFLKKVWNLNIIGDRLWYIYKNECSENITQLINKELELFTSEYFYEKYEKYCKR